MTIRQSVVLAALVWLAISVLGTPRVPLPAQDGRTEPGKRVIGASSRPTQKRTAFKPFSQNEGQFNPGVLEAQKAAVVKVLVKRKDGTTDQATGLFVGVKGEDAYLITALHAIVEDPKSDYPVLVKSIEVRFRASNGLAAIAEPKVSQGLDLGVVRVSASKIPRSLPKILLKDAAEGVLVHIIGNPASGDWSVWSGDIQNATVSNNPRLFRTSTNGALAGGYSGGPVLDYGGAFLGMHTSTTSDYGTAAKSQAIVQQLQAWTIPTDNLTTPPPLGISDSVTATVEEADSKAINKVLDAYEAAYNRKDAEAIWRIWPSATGDRRRTIQTTFILARSITLKITDRQIELAPGRMSAIVTAQSTKDVVPRQGSAPPRLNLATTFKLEKQNGTWLIVAVM